MNIAVCIKQTFDTEAQIKLINNCEVNREGINLIINPYDEFALEEAIQIKENFGGTVTVISLGGTETEDALRQALAMGADKAILIENEAINNGDEATTALVLAEVLKEQPYDLIFCGWKAIDDGSAQVAVRVAERLNLPQVCLVTKFELKDGFALAHREADGGSEIVEVKLPALITAQKGLNEPRYPSLRGIMQAKKKELRRLTTIDLSLDQNMLSQGVRVKILELTLPEVRSNGKIYEGNLEEACQMLVNALIKDTKVI